MKPETQNHIIKEQFFQGIKWKDHHHTVGEWLIILNDILKKAGDKWMNKGDIMCLYEILQLAASAATCLDEHSTEVQGRKLSDGLEKLFQDQSEKKELPTLKGVDRLILRLEQLQQDLTASQKENNQNKKKIKDLEQKVKELQVQENEKEDPFPWSKIPKPHHPESPWHPIKPVPQWDPNNPGWPYSPIITCESGYSRENQ